MKSRAFRSIAILLSLAATQLPAIAAARPQLTLAQAIADAVASAAIATPPGAVQTSGLPMFTLATSLSTAPEEGQRGAVTEREEVTFDLRPGATTAALQSARARFAQSAASLRQSRRALVAGVVSAFFAVAMDQADVDAARETLDLARRSFAAASRRHRVGVAPAVDVERAAIALDQAKADAGAAASALDGDRAALLRLTNENAGDAVVLIPAAGAPLPGADELADDVLATNPAITAADAAVAAMQAEAKVARAEFQPSLSVGAGLGRSVLRDSQAIGPAANVSLGIPLTGGVARANVASSDAAVAAAQAQLRQAQADAVQDALRALTDAQREASRIDALQDAYSRAQRVAEDELQGYAIGAVASIDVITAQTQASAARTALAEARTAAARADAMVKLSMGTFDR